MEKPVRHRLLDAQCRLVNWPDLVSWNPATKNLGTVVYNIVDTFSREPPQLIIGAPAPAPVAYPPPMGAQTAPMGGAGYIPGGGAGLPSGPPGGQPSVPSTAASVGGAGVAGASTSVAPAPPGPLKRSESLGVEVSLDAVLSRPSPSDSRASTASDGPGVSVPSEFPELQGMAIETLTMLAEAEELRRCWLATRAEVKGYDEMIGGAREETSKLAESNALLAAKLQSLSEQLTAQQATCKRKQAELAALVDAQKALQASFTPAKLSRDLDTAAEELGRLSDERADGFIAGAGPYAGIAAGTSKDAQAAAVHAFAADFLALRKRYHAAKAKAQIVAAAGFVRE